jgi:hypothetical protein
MIRIFSAFAGLVISAAALSPAFAENRPSVFSATIQQQKIKHPTEAMSKEEHTVILNNMRQKRNDAEKVIALKESVKDKGITIEQLITLLNQFLSDDAKLECAQYAFPYTTNYKAFLKIMDLFSQEGYKWRLEEYYDKNRK